MKRLMKSFIVLSLIIVLISCNQGRGKTTTVANTDTTGAAKIISSKKPICCESNLPNRFAVTVSHQYNINGNIDSASSATTVSHDGMVWINSGTFMMGGDNAQAQPDEYPKHKVTV